MPTPENRLKTSTQRGLIVPIPIFMKKSDVPVRKVILLRRSGNPIRKAITNYETPFDRFVRVIQKNIFTPIGTIRII